MTTFAKYAQKVSTFTPKMTKIQIHLLYKCNILYELIEI